MLIFGGFITIVAGGIYAWIRPGHLKAKQIEYAGLRLGMTMSEVKYVKGIPSHVHAKNVLALVKLEEGKNLEDYKNWRYYDTGLQVIFIENLLAAVACIWTDTIPRCPDISGITNGDSEQTLVSTFGQPSTEKIGDITKEMTYQNLGVMVDLQQQQVIALGIYDTRYSFTKFSNKEY
jgi:hypothetical protein